MGIKGIFNTNITDISCVITHFSKSLQRRARRGEGTRQVKVKSSQVPEVTG
jgi:hypothetical protein